MCFLLLQLHLDRDSSLEASKVLVPQMCHLLIEGSMAIALPALLEFTVSSVGSVCLFEADLPPRNHTHIAIVSLHLLHGLATHQVFCPRVPFDLCSEKKNEPI